MDASAGARNPCGLCSHTITEEETPQKTGAGGSCETAYAILVRSQGLVAYHTVHPCIHFLHIRNRPSSVGGEACPQGDSRSGDNDMSGRFQLDACPGLLPRQAFQSKTRHIQNGGQVAGGQTGTDNIRGKFFRADSHHHGLCFRKIVPLVNQH